jgi:hypothetical protein
VRPYGARHPSAAFLARTVRSSHTRPLIVDQKQHCGRRLLSALRRSLGAELEMLVAR